MTQKTSPIICDGCGGDITTTGNSIDFRLKLSTYSPMAWFVKEGRNNGMMTDALIYPSIDGTKHFCNSLNCVKAWLGKETK